MFSGDGDEADAPANASSNATFEDILGQRVGRRGFLTGALLAAVGAGLPSEAEAAAEPAFAFDEIEATVTADHAVADGYDARVLLRWGDPLFPDMTPFDPLRLTAEEQERRFGYNNDYVGYLPIDGSSRHGLLVVNHEYTNEELMFRGLGGEAKREDRLAKITPEMNSVQMAAHGGAVVEIRRSEQGWEPVLDSRFNRRITARTPMDITGPAAGSPRLSTSADPGGRRVLGMINNCSGGMTPWGTWLSGEENFHFYFDGRVAPDHREAANHRRYGLSRAHYAWSRLDPRFDVPTEPNEANRFGWVVEIDPLDPTSIPKKRTALGRMKHEGAAGAFTADGRYCVYLGDDERYEYVYRFVSEDRVDPKNPAANRDILDRGILSVARFDADGTGIWLPLVHGEGPLTEANGFASQADVLIDTRRAADLLGPTKMDRPEDIEANPRTGRVYVLMTNNSRRKAEEVNAANPRPLNAFGHIIEMIPDGGDQGSPRFRWEMLLLCGDPGVPEIGATFSPQTTRNGWFGMPDNCAIDARGRLWIATDGNDKRRTGRSDGLWAVETEGELRGTSRHFYRVPVGAEMCGPFFTPDDETLFLAVQHPGESDDRTTATFDRPETRWPDFRDDMPPRPSVIAITKRGGGRIG
nr:PhoX family phosphatase [Enterovirga rhinocerotis]